MNLQLPNNDIYFDENYLKIYENIGEGKLYFFNFEMAGLKAIYPFLVNSVNSLGYKLQSEFYDIQGAYGYNGVLTNSYDKSFISAFYVSFEEYCAKNNIIAEFTRFHPLLRNHQFSEKHMEITFDRNTVALDLRKSYEDIWTNDYTSNNRNMIRKAHKFGYSCDIIQEPSLSLINKFIMIYYGNMVKVKADDYYFFKRDYFINLFSNLKKYIYLLNVRNKDGRIQCSSIFFHYGPYFHYHLSGRKEETDNSITNFILDEAVRLAITKGGKYFHFGGGRTGDENDSLLKFKGNFSKMRLPFYIGKRIYNKEIYNNVIRQWKIKYPEKIQKYGNRVLMYRY